jgi:hypothetical protein
MPQELPNIASSKPITPLTGLYYSVRKQYNKNGEHINDEPFWFLESSPFLEKVITDPKVKEQFSKYFSLYLYCFSFPEVPYDNPGYASPEGVEKNTRRRFIFFKRPVNRTLQLMLKMGYQIPEQKVVITIKNRLKIVRHIIKMHGFLISIDLKVCRFRFMTLLLYPLKSKKDATFTAIAGAEQNYMYYQLLSSVTEQIQMKDTPCIESVPERRYSPGSMDPENIDENLYKQGKILDNKARQFSLAILALGFEYMYRVEPVDVSDVLMCYTRQYWAHIKKYNINKYSTEDLYWDHCDKWVKNYYEIRDKMEVYLSYNVNRLQIYSHMKQFKELPPSIIADKENFFEAYMFQNPEYDFQERFLSYQFISLLVFKMNFQNLKQKSFNFLENFQTKMESTFMDYYELIYPKSTYTIPKDPKLLFDENTRNNLIEYIASIKFDDQLLGVYFDLILNCFNNYLNPDTSVLDYLDMVNTLIQKHDDAVDFMVTEIPRIKSRNLVDIVFQVRNGKIFIRGYDAMRVIILSNKKVKATGILLA